MGEGAAEEEAWEGAWEACRSISDDERRDVRSLKPPPGGREGGREIHCEVCGGCAWDLLS